MVDTRLVVNEIEADRVRQIFELYVEHEAVGTLVESAAERPGAARFGRLASSAAPVPLAVKLWKRWERGDDEALEVLLKYNEEDIVHLKPLADLAYRTLRARNLEPGRVDEPEDLALA